VNISSNPSRLFDPGDIVPRWGESDLYKRVSDSGEGYWYICTPVNVEFIYRCSSVGDVESNSVKCDVEMQTILGSESSCRLVYAISDEDWFAENVTRDETVLKNIRDGNVIDSYKGLMFFTKLNGQITDIRQFANGESRHIEFDIEIFAEHRFSVYRDKIYRTKGEDDETEYWLGWLDEVVIVPEYDDEEDDDGFLDDGGSSFEDDDIPPRITNGGSPYRGGGGGFGKKFNNGNSLSGLGNAISYNKKECFVGYDVSKDCFSGAKQIIKNMCKSVPALRTDIATLSADGKGVINKTAAASAVAFAMASLDSSNPVIMGVTHSDFTMSSTNNNHATQHFVVVTGYGKNGNEYYFTYIETGRYAGSWEGATSDGNRLYYDSDTGKITGSNYNSTGKNPRWSDYIVTEIRTND